LADKEQELDIAEGDIFKDTQDVLEAAISRAVTTTISTTVTAVISREITGVEMGKVGGGNQQFEYMQNVD